MVIGDLRVDRSARRVQCGAAEVALRPKEFDLIERLARNPGAVVSREQLIDDVWDEHWWGSTKTLDVHINSLRRKLGESPGGTSRITTRARRRLSTRRGSGPAVRRRIVALIVAVAACSVAAFFVPAMLAIRSTTRRREMLELQREGSIVASDIALAGSVDLATLRHGLPADHAVAVYDSDGSLTEGEGPANADAVVREGYAGSIAEGYVDGDLVVEVPVRPAGSSTMSVVRVLEPGGESARGLRERMTVLVGAVVAVIAAAGLAGLLFSSWLSAPLERLRRWATGFGGELQPAPPTGIAELDQLGSTIEDANTRIHRLLERERSFSSHVSHQLRTPVAAARVAIEAELADPRPDPRLALHESLDALDRLEGTITGLLTLARRPTGRRCGPTWAISSRTASTRWSSPFAHVGREVVAEVGAAPTVVDGETAHHVLDVLLDNALVHGVGRVTLAAAVSGGRVAIDVADEGDGADARDPFSDRPAGGGHGIGLHLARTLAESVGGELVQLPDRTHTVFRLSLRSPDADLALTER